MAVKPTDGKFSLAYFLNGEGAKDWWRSLGDATRVGIVAAVVFCLVFTVKTMFFPGKPQGNVNRPGGNTAIVTPFSKTGDITMTSTSTNEQKVEAAKRSWWIPHLYSGIAVGGRMKTSGTSLDFGSVEPEIRADILGLRWDWN